MMAASSGEGFMGLMSAFSFACGMWQSHFFAELVSMHAYAASPVVES